ncbi:dTDP-4-amino-4,6-dideoxygalactose transaminase [Lentibacillus sediminis]|uniref:dTDP-4-amino-4,6-dideoxygalactose transaminase n=1 Tax=Lentibacillus sediminis TaxID=1940529 RepID=UPI000C1BA39F|nr:dTDP-4-amino-4,6-dideoxygalactose transaminase [Lentibacillus sediminis]
MIPFNKPCVVGGEQEAIQEAISRGKLSGNGTFGKWCTDWLEEELPAEKAILTPSCTAALEMTALLTEVGSGDEVIMPSYTFVSTANAYALRGAAIRFVDIDPDTMNVDPAAIEAAVTPRTKAIVVVHYAGVGCDMDAIMEIADAHGLWVVEDAAQGLMSTYKGRALGTIGHLGTFSFHETKNYQCGEGGALIVNDPALVERAEILQEKGTDRSQFVKGMIDKYTWRDLGSSYLLSELNAAYLSVQLKHAETINENRLLTWDRYLDGLEPLEEAGKISLPVVPDGARQNAHMFYIKVSSDAERTELIGWLKEKGVMAVTHYVPLHSAQAGKKFGKFSGGDRWTTTESEKLLRLPLYYGIKQEDVDDVIRYIFNYFQV